MDAFLAIYDDNIQALREYLELGDVNIKNERGMSLLHSAILFSNSEIFDLLLESYINVNMKDNYGNTPSHLCVIHNRLGFLKMLIRHNADLNIKNQQKLNLLKKYNTKEIFNMDFTELLKNELDENDVKILKFKNLDDAEKALNIMETQNIKLFSFKQNEYPNKLQYIDNKPAFIYVRGDYNILDNDSVRYSRM